MYTAKKLPNGNYEIYLNGQRISTGSASILANYGLSDTSTQTSPYDPFDTSRSLAFGTVNSGTTTPATQPQTSTRQKAIDYLKSIGYANPDEGEIQGAISEMIETKSSTNIDLKAIDDTVNKVVESVVASGKTLNPNLTPEDFATIDPATFLAQAEAAIAPEYRQKFQVIKEGLSRKLSNIGYDLSLKKTSIERQADETLRTGTEDLAGRGLAFSSGREKFTGDVGYAKNADIESARTLAFRNAQDLGSQAEQQIGTSALQSYSVPQFEGRSPFSFSSTPLTGSLTSEQQYLKESMARELETQARARKAYSTRDLAFA